MENMVSSVYEAPSAEVLLVAQEIVVCGSPVEIQNSASAPTYNSFNAEEEW